MIFGYFIILGLSWAAWLMYMVFVVITGPQNVMGWLVNLAIVTLIPLVGWSAARVLDWRTRRTR